MSGLVDAIFGGGDDAPAPDPAIGQAAMRSAEVGNRALDFYQQIYNTDVRPRQDRLDSLTIAAGQQQISDAKAASQFAEEQRGLYRDTYVPLERQVVSDAQNYDSAQNVNQRMGVASANVTQSFDKARAASIATLQKYGLNPNSGAFAATNSRLAGQQALADANARTGAAFDTMDRGIALRAGAAQTGRGLANSAAQSLSTGTAAGSAAVSGANQSAQTGIAGAGVGGQGFTTAIGANTAGGNLMLGQYQGQLQGYGMQQERSGALIGAGATLGAAAIFSSKKVKERNEPLDPRAVLEKVRGLKVDGWSYKGDAQRHIGPYAEDLHQKFGVGDGATIGPTDAGGIALAAVKGLAEDMDQIKAALGVQHKGLRKQ